MVNKSEKAAALNISRHYVMTVTANFTAEPVGDTLRFWMERLDLQPARLEFSPYNQVFQELIAPDSLLASSEPGVNFLLVRLEDWARQQKSGQHIEAISRTSREFIEALEGFAKRARRPTVLLLCPPSRSAQANALLNGRLRELEAEVRSAVADVRGINVIGAEELAKLLMTRRATGWGIFRLRLRIGQRWQPCWRARRARFWPPRTR
jgi:hypothetical protein